MATPTNYSACVYTYTVLNFSRDQIFVVNVQPAKIFNHENFRLYGILAISAHNLSKYGGSIYYNPTHNIIIIKIWQFGVLLTHLAPHTYTGTHSDKKSKPRDACTT